VGAEAAGKSTLRAASGAGEDTTVKPIQGAVRNGGIGPSEYVDHHRLIGIRGVGLRIDCSIRVGHGEHIRHEGDWLDAHDHAGRRDSVALDLYGGRGLAADFEWSHAHNRRSLELTRGAGIRLNRIRVPLSAVAT
jgi:hypothetical protein